MYGSLRLYLTASSQGFSSSKNMEIGERVLRRFSFLWPGRFLDGANVHRTGNDVNAPSLISNTYGTKTFAARLHKMVLDFAM